MEQNSAEARVRALKILNRVLEIKHSDNPNFELLRECQQEASELQKKVSSDLQPPDLEADITALASEEHPLAALLMLVEQGGNLEENRRYQLEDIVEHKWSSQLSKEVQRKKLTIAPQKILQERYELTKLLHSDSDSESWLGKSEDVYYLIKLWRYQDEQPDEFDFWRAFWNRELRTLYRLSSSPNAEESILTMREAGIDRDKQAFVMVLKSEGEGYQNLAEALKNRDQHKWLVRNNLRDPNYRERLWQGLKELAIAIQLLHKQNVLHRNIGAENVYLNLDEGPESWRLGGFESSVRLGSEAVESPNIHWGIPPEELQAGYTFDTDWYAFGMLAARCFDDIEKLSFHQSDELHRRVYNDVDQKLNGYSYLSSEERELIKALIAPNQDIRLASAQDIVSRLDQILKDLASGSIRDKKNLPLVLVFRKKSIKLLFAAQNGGFKQDNYSPDNLSHLAALKRFLRDHLEGAWLHPDPKNPDIYLLEGRQGLTLRIAQFEDKRAGTEKTWDLAFITGPQDGQLRRDPEQSRDLSGIPIEVVELGDKKPTKSRTWRRYLPSRQTKKFLTGELEKFHDFLRCTNQLDLLMRDAEVFKYSIIHQENNDGIERIRIKEEKRERPVADFCQISGGMLEFLNQEMESNKHDSRLLFLSEDDKLNCPENRPIKNDENKGKWWEIVSIQDGYIELERTNTGEFPAPPESGYLRTQGHYGQIRLIERRKAAIDLLKNHSYLLRSMVQPGFVTMDTGTVTPLGLTSENLGEYQKAVLQDILRVRPIYALQGPPGTGKTTLVANLLCEILDEDPTTQILVTAQAHGAVDRLREKVKNVFTEAFPERNLPLSIRLGIDDTDKDAAEGTTEYVTRELLKDTDKELEELAKQQQLTDIQQEWQATVTKMLEDAELQFNNKWQNTDLLDFLQLVKRGANITYCTTTNRDLGALADGSDSLFDWSFDWSIVEEAGKAHGFDLALPLQMGHRWMLLGDQKQLDPYRYQNYQRGIENLDDAVDKLKKLDHRLRDVSWIDAWEKIKEQEKQKEFIAFAGDWIRSFEHTFTILSEKVYGDTRLTETKSSGAHAGQLLHQYRMHPHINNLISNIFYEGKIKNIKDESEFLHPFVTPIGIQNKAITWIDVPWCQQDDAPDCQEQSRFINYREVMVVEGFLRQLSCMENPDDPLEVAVLSPYNQQVNQINKKLKKFNESGCLKRCKSLRGGTEQDSKWAHSVDSFQGNEADVIIVSLVRNNREIDIQQALGFLRDIKRLNVMLSRAERLLVLLGSWEFFNFQLRNITPDDRDFGHWKHLLSTLADGFNAGWAVKISDTTVISNRGE